MIWVCILCRKKQELLVKTGQWIYSSMATRLQQLEAETPLETPTLSFDKKPRLERAFSAEKENQLYSHVNAYQERRGSLELPARPAGKGHPLFRQYSHDAAHTSQRGSGSIWSEHDHDQSSRMAGDFRDIRSHLLPTVPLQAKPYMQRMMPGVPGDQSRMTNKPPTESELTLAAVESGIGSDTAGSGIHKKLPRQGSRELTRVENLNWSSMESGNGTQIGYESGPERSSASAVRRQLPHQHSLGAQMPHLTSSGSGHGFITAGPSTTSVPCELLEMSTCRDRDRDSQSAYHYDATVSAVSGGLQYAHPSTVRRQLFSSNSARSRSSLLDPNSARLVGRRRDSFVRNDSLSSDQSENVSQPAPRPHHRTTRVRREKIRQQFSLSSSEEELRSTPEFAEDDFYYQSLGEQSGLKCQKSLKREEILDAKIKRFLAVSNSPSLPLSSYCTPTLSYSHSKPVFYCTLFNSLALFPKVFYHQTFAFMLLSLFPSPDLSVCSTTRFPRELTFTSFLFSFP